MGDRWNAYKIDLNASSWGYIDAKSILKDIGMSIVMHEIEEEVMSLKFTHLVKDGVWLVPPSERFEGWEKLGVKENRDGKTT